MNLAVASRRTLGAAAAAAALACAFAAFAYPHPAGDAQIRRLVIRQAIATSGASCPCPYSKTRKGKLCGSRSLYYQRGGVPMQCYAKDVSDDDVDAYRVEHGLERR